MNKTIYLREEEAPIWERARELSGDKLSPVIVTALRGFITQKEAESKGFERIVVQFRDSRDHCVPRAKAFYGKWIIPPDETFGVNDEHTGDGIHYSVAVTAKGGAFLYCWNVSMQDGEKYHERIYIYPSLEAGAADREINMAIRTAIERVGVPVEELDI